jgi:hypothetical protein
MLSTIHTYSALIYQTFQTIAKCLGFTIRQFSLHGPSIKANVLINICVRERKTKNIYVSTRHIYQWLRFPRGMCWWPVWTLDFPPLNCSSKECAKLFLSDAHSATNPKGCPFPSISFPVRLVWHWGVQPGKELSRVLSNWTSRRYLFGDMSVKMQKVPKSKSRFPSSLNWGLLPPPISSYAKCLFCVHFRLQSLLVEQFIPFSVQVGFMRLMFNTHASHRIFLRFLLNLAPYAAVDKKLLHTLTLCTFQNTENHQMVLSDTFPNGTWNIEFSDF